MKEDNSKVTDLTAGQKGETVIGRTMGCWFCKTRSLVRLMAHEWQAYHDGALVQDAFPHLNANEREFILHGLHPECWHKMFPR